jgi:hypothetical protein
MKRITVYSSYLVPDDQIDATFTALMSVGERIAKTGEGVVAIGTDINVSTTDQYGNPLDTED